MFSSIQVRAVGLLGSRAVRRPRLRVPHTRPNCAPNAPAPGQVVQWLLLGKLVHPLSGELREARSLGRVNEESLTT